MMSALLISLLMAINIVLTADFMNENLAQTLKYADDHEQAKPLVQKRNGEGIARK